ncbi:MAG: nucleotidyltransferase domain-containing protein [Phycisphaerales bacterium]|nr:nucleotidyltransferase domain-containing protein [Phycisphaerales bacterium]
MILHDIVFPAPAIAQICRQHRVARLSLFGSILTDRFGPSSDIDMLVSFEPGASLSLFDVGSLQGALTDLLGRQVHLTDADTVPPAVLGRLSRESRVQYAA